MQEHRISNISNLSELQESRKILRWSRSKLRHFLNNKRGYSTEGSTLLPSVLRPRLFGAERSNFSKFRKVSLTALSIIGISAIIGTSLGISNNSVSAVSATLSIPDDISINVDPNKNNGFAESSNGAISVSTGNLNGYTLTIKAKDNNQLKNGGNVLNSISTNLTTDQYKTGNYVNTWGFKPSSLNNDPNTNYIPGPDANGITLASTHTNSSTNENYSIGIAAKVDSNTIAGDYTNTFILTATANEARYTIAYDASSLSGATNANLFTTDSNIITGDTQVINTSVPTRDDKSFKGWCDEPLQSDGSCKGSVIQAGGNLRMCKCNTEVTLYAMWGEKEVPKDGDSCSHSGYSGSAKLYGGLCWMWTSLNNGATYTWNQAKTICPSGWHLPSEAEFKKLLDAIGAGNQLYNAGWHDNAYTSFYWSSTVSSNNINAIILHVQPNGASVGGDVVYDNYYVRCVAD